MYKSRSGRVFFALIVILVLGVIGRNLYRRYLNNALVAAIRADDVSAVRSLLQRGADARYRFTDPPNARGPVLPQTVLDLAISKVESINPAWSLSNSKQQVTLYSLNPNAETIACLLIRYGADLRHRDYLYDAFRMGDIPLARALFDRDLRFMSAQQGQMAVGAVMSYANPYGNTDHSGGLTPAEQADVAHRRPVSLQMEQLLREHGVHLTLSEAMQLKDTAAVRTILHGSRTEWASEGYDALYLAAEKGDLELARQLLHHGVDPNVFTVLSPLCAAAGSGNVAMVKLLLEHGAKVNANGSYSPLISAAWGGHTELIRLFLAHGADPNAHQGRELSALAVALRKAPSAAPDLLKHGAHVNPVSRFSYGVGLPVSPLINAVWYAPQYESMLPQAGAQIGADRTGICAVAARQGRADLLPKLIAYGADVNGKDAGGDTALAMCVEHAPASVAILLAHGADPNLISHSLQTLLEQAAMIGNIGVVRLLLAHGADINARTDHHTALEWAERKGHADVVALLQEAGANATSRR